MAQAKYKQRFCAIGEAQLGLSSGYTKNVRVGQKTAL
jgi:hypothetical protein